MIIFPIGVDLKYQVDIKQNPERKPTRKYKIPPDIKRPAANTMEKVYTDGEYLYRIAPFSFPEKEHIGRMMACTSYLYYGIAKYEVDTGRFLGSLYSHTDKDTVKRVFEKAVEYSELKKIENPYLLYDLRISNGYCY